MIGFPAIGFEFNPNPIIFRIGEGFALTWYAVILVFGLLLAVLFCLRQAKHFGIKQEELYDALFCAVPAAVVGSRLYYVLFNLERYSEDPISIIRTWEGGLSIHGALIGAVAAAVIFCKIKKINIGAMLDLAAFGLLIGQAVGRFGNFVNGEVYGTETTLPWRMLVGGSEVHPLFLYESLWNMLGFAGLFFIFKKRKFNGQIFAIYIAWYGLGRAMLEGLRADAFNLMLGGVMISQLVAIVSCVAAVVFLFWSLIFRKHPPLMEWTAARDERIAAKKAAKSAKAETTAKPKAELESVVVDVEELIRIKEAELNENAEEEAVDEE